MQKPVDLVDSSSDDDNQVFIEVTDPIQVKKLTKQERKTHPRQVLKPVVEDASKQLIPMQKDKVHQGKSELKPLQSPKFNSQAQHYQKWTSKNQTEVKQHQPSGNHNLGKKPRMPNKRKQEGKKQWKVENNLPKNTIKIYPTMEIETIVEEANRKLREHDFIELKAMKGASIEKAFLTVLELQKISPTLQRVNIPETFSEEGKNRAAVTVQISLKPNKLDSMHMGFQEGPYRKQLSRNNLEKGFNKTHQPKLSNTGTEGSQF